MIKDVEYPFHLRQGICPVARAYPTPRNLRVFGADTETCRGKPMTLQICGPDDEYFSYVDDKLIFPEFWRWLRARVRPGGINLCYFHNLNFDIRVLFADHLKTIYEQHSDIKFKTEIDGQEIEVKILFGKVNKFDIKAPGVRLQVLDSRHFTQASLARSLKMFGIADQKHEFTFDDSNRDIRFDALPSTDPNRIKFEAYSKQDARAERGLGLKIMEFHEAYHVGPSISLPSYAAKVFKHHFLRVGESIPFPPTQVVQASEKSYHGGKNGYYESVPRIFENLYEVDINSAYPHGMKALPSLTAGEYCRVDNFQHGYAAIYCLSGEVIGGKYPLVYDHGFKPVKGRFTDLWHTSYETERILSFDNHIRVDSIYGYAWVPADGGTNPFARFVDHFYGKKEATPKSDPYYHFYKIVLNALYGKLVSTIEVRSVEAEDEIKKLRELGVDIPVYIRIDERYDKVLGKFVHMTKNWRAGSMYNPFLASLITGHARSALFDLETRLAAVHSATDSVKTPIFTPAVSGLGGLKIECFGRCYIFRNKLYLHFSKSGDYCGHKTPPFKYPKTTLDGAAHPKAEQPLVDYDGQHLCKVALHGYKGPLWVLFDARHDLIKTGKLPYIYWHVVGLREGLKRGQTPADFIKVYETLNLFEPYEPEHLLTFIIKNGGFSYEKETQYKGEIRRWSRRETGIKGLVNTVQGHTCDKMRGLCMEAGYLREDDDINALWDAVERAVRGEKIYGINYQPDFGDVIYPDSEGI